MTIVVSPELNKECKALATQIERRYGSPMFRKMFGDNEAYSKDCALGFIRSQIDAPTVLNVRTWLMQGLKPFSEYPPSLEMMISMGRTLKCYPVSEAQLEFTDFWYLLDAQFGQSYGRFWKSEVVIEGLQRERVWLSEFEAQDASDEELTKALMMIKESVLFRTYPPSLPQFKSALLSIRKGSAPLVEDAWLLAMTVRPGQPLHPLIVKARSKISTFDLNNNGKSWENQQRFQAAYLELLKSEGDVVDEPEVVQVTEPVEYASTDDLLAALKRM